MALRMSKNARPRPAAQGADFEEGAGTSCGPDCCPGYCPGYCPGWNSDCGSGGPRRGRVGRPSPGLGGEPACRAPNSEPESGPRRAGGAGDAGGAEGAVSASFRNPRKSAGLKSTVLPCSWGAFSSGLSASVSSFFLMRPNASGAHQT